MKEGYLEEVSVRSSRCAVPYLKKEDSPPALPRIHPMCSFWHVLLFVLFCCWLQVTRILNLRALEDLSARAPAPRPARPAKVTLALRALYNLPRPVCRPPRPRPRPPRRRPRRRPRVGARPARHSALVECPIRTSGMLRCGLSIGPQLCPPRRRRLLPEHHPTRAPARVVPHRPPQLARAAPASHDPRVCRRRRLLLLLLLRPAQDLPARAPADVVARREAELARAVRALDDVARVRRHRLLLLLLRLRLPGRPVQHPCVCAGVGPRWGRLAGPQFRRRG